MIKSFGPAWFTQNQSPGLTKCQAWLQQAQDQTSSVLSRIEAIENLARECHEHQVFQTLSWLLQNATEDRSVQRTILRLMPNWGKGPMQLSVLLGALSIPGLRTEAIAALDSLAPEIPGSARWPLPNCAASEKRK